MAVVAHTARTAMKIVLERRILKLVKLNEGVA